MSKRKSTARAKLKAATQEERVHSWKEYFKNLLGKSSEVTDEPITKIIDNRQELDVVLRKIKKKNAASLNEIPNGTKNGIQGNSMTYYNPVYNQNTIDRWTKGCILPFHKKGDLRIAKNYRGITLTFMAAKIYNALLLNRIELETDKIYMKNQNSFWRNQSTTLQILTICQILEGVCAKNVQAISISPRHLTPYTEERWSKYF